MLYLYNTASRKKEKLVPLIKNTVKIYSCGPTLYNYAHIGNLSTYLFVDLLKKYLEYSSYEVYDVMNFTDVDDKTIKSSKGNKTLLNEITKKYGDSVLSDFDKLNIREPKVLCKATDHIKEMIKIVQILLDMGIAYVAEDKSVYFRIAKFDSYGEFAKIKKKDLLAGASGRVAADEYEKEDLSDFVLWKAWNKDDGEIYWESPFGRGRPGWHIECSAMSMKYLGPSFDIHTGAVDLIFPHHQNEIAQSEAATGKKFVKIWLHRQFLQVNKTKMSKKLHNIYTLQQLLNKIPSPLAFRYLVLASHYRSPLNFTFKSLRQSNNAIDKLGNFIERIFEQEDKQKDTRQNLSRLKKECTSARKSFVRYMDDDLDTPRALASLYVFTKRINSYMDDDVVGPQGAKLVVRFLKEIDTVWGFIFQNNDSLEDSKLKTKVKNLVSKRNEYRRLGKWEKADVIRKKLLAMGVTVKDTQ